MVTSYCGRCLCFRCYHCFRPYCRSQQSCVDLNYKAVHVALLIPHRTTGGSFLRFCLLRSSSSYLVAPMLDPCEGAVVDLTQVFVSACWALRTTPENVVHGLTLLATGTFWTVCKSPPVHIFVCLVRALLSVTQSFLQTDVPFGRCSWWGGRASFGGLISFSIHFSSLEVKDWFGWSGFTVAKLCLGRRRDSTCW